MATHVRVERPDGAPRVEGYHMPKGAEPVNVYHARDIPADLHVTQRSALSWLLRGPQRPALLATLLGIPKAQRRGLDSHIGNMTFRVGNLCEIDSDDPLIGYQIGLVARDGASIIGA